MKYKNEAGQLFCAYLFLSAENRISDADFALFEEIGKSVKEFPEIKGNLIGGCESFLASPENGKSRYEFVSEFFSEKSFESEADNRAYLWTLINLQYQTEKKSEKKQQLVELFIKSNKIDESIVLEMHDTYETAYALSKYQDWLETSKGMNRRESDPIMKELEKNQKSLEQSVNDLIALG